MERAITVRTELESILVEQALAMAHELESVTDAAADGQVLAVGEQAALRLGREFTRVALEAALQRQAGEAEKKGPPEEHAPAEDAARSRTRRPKRP